MCFIICQTPEHHFPPLHLISSPLRGKYFSCTLPPADFCPENNESTMKSIWVFVLGIAINLYFIATSILSYWADYTANDPFLGKPAPPYVALVLALLVLAGIVARKNNRPGLANLLVLLVPILGGAGFLFLVFIFNAGTILPADFGFSHLAVIALAIVGIYYAFKLKVGRMRRIFDAARQQAAAKQNAPKAPKNHRGANGQRVIFASDGRSGHVFYESPEGKFSMYYEFGGGDVVVIISVPETAQWVAQTGIPLEKREEVLNYIGQVSVAQQTKNGSYKLDANSILIYS